jgi:hypothetical protein
MTMLEEQVDGAIGVDTHRDTLAAAAVSAVGAVLAHAEAAIDVQRYGKVLSFGRTQFPALGAGRWRGREATGPAWPPFSMPMANVSSRCAAEAASAARRPKDRRDRRRAYGSRGADR